MFKISTKRGEIEKMRKVALALILVLALSLPVFAASEVRLEKITGYLSSTMDKDTFTINCDKDEQTFVFDWNRDSDFYVKVFGMTGKLLGDFRLSEGEEIILTGGGKFTIRVYSEEGEGEWSVVPKGGEEDDESSDGY